MDNDAVPGFGFHQYGPLLTALSRLSGQGDGPPEPQAICALLVQGGMADLAWMAAVRPTGGLTALGQASAPSIAPAEQANQHFLPAESLGRRVWQNGSPLIAADINDLAASDKDPLLARGLHSLAVWPLWQGDRVTAVLVLLHSTPAFYTDATALCCAALAGVINQLLHLPSRQRDDLRATKRYPPPPPGPNHHFDGAGKYSGQGDDIFTAIQDPALIVDRAGIILDANPATLAAAGKLRHQVVGGQVCDILHGGRQAGTICPLESFLATGKARILESELRGLDGTYLLTLSPLRAVGQEVTLLVARDLAEEELIKAEALRTAQLVAIGELAAGVAHEINNPINGIMNYAQLLLDDHGNDPGGSELLQRIIDESRRVSIIAHKLLDFARRREEHVEAASLPLLINACLDLIGHQLNNDGISLQKSLPDDLPEIICNAQQIQQVILNVLSNARYALNQKYPHSTPDKCICLSAEALQRDGRRMVALTIHDHGVGIEQDIMTRLFDPFFSTKPKGEGTGLGLSISHGIIRDHQGSLRISSQLGSSTTVVIELPLSQSDEVAHA